MSTIIRSRPPTSPPPPPVGTPSPPPGVTPLPPPPPGGTPLPPPSLLKEEEEMRILALPLEVEPRIPLAIKI
ncbi:hypothetical protein ACFX16_030950 [Malus domestica]